jgi:hypothetical protein
MKVRTSVFVIILMTALTLPPVALTQDFAPKPPTWQKQERGRDWVSLQRFPVGVKVIVETKDDEVFKGKLESVTDDSLRLTIDGRSIDLKRGDISKAYLTRASSRSSYAAIDAGYIGVLGLLIGAAVSGKTKNRNAIHVGFAAGIGAGALIGAIGGGGGRGELIYEMK